MKNMLDKVDLQVDRIESRACLLHSPLVSVLMTTFNHERFIAQALDGILMQEVEFPYEVVIGEDKSTDRTREIVCEYQRMHPDKIRLRLSKENLYSQGLKPGWGVLHACRGKYIAMCEGDDYWTDPQKLQKQVAVLKNDPGLSFCFHNVEVINDTISEWGAESFFPVDGRKALFARPPDRIGVSDILEGNFIPTASVLVRSGVALPIPRWIGSLPAGDWGHFIHWLQQGAGAYLDELMGVYRIHKGGVWSGQGKWEIAFKGWEAYDTLFQNLGRDLHGGLERGREHLRTTFLNNLKGECTQRLQARRSLGEFREYIEKKAPPGLCPDPAGWRSIRAAAAEDAFYGAFHAGDGPDASRLLRELAKASPTWFLRRGSAGVVAELMRRGFRGKATPSK